MVNMQDFKCPNCGGSIEFDPNAQKLKCPYCDCEFDVQAAIEDANQLPQDRMKWEKTPSKTYSIEDEQGVITYACNSCGGSIIADKNTAATSCPYCGSPVVLSGKVGGTLKPDYIIPFKLDKETAKARLKEHFNKKFFLPKVFKDENHLDEIHSLYVPFWLFDTDADAQIKYRATKTRVWSDSNYTYTETSFYNCYREGGISFEHVPVDGSEKIDDQLMESIEPYNFAEATDFNVGFLAGYVADNYDVDTDQTIERANQRIKTSAEDAFRDTVNGYTSVNVSSSSVVMNSGKADYAMYPVYILNTTWNDEKYVVAMNGQTGKFVGNLPLDKGKFARFLIFLGLGISAGIYGIRWLVELLRFGGVF